MDQWVDYANLRYQRFLVSLTFNGEGRLHEKEKRKDALVTDRHI